MSIFSDFYDWLRGNRRPAQRLSIRFGAITEQENLMQLITVTQQVEATLNPQDSRGNPAKLDGVPTWSSSDEAVATVEASADGLTAKVKAQGIGIAQIRATADADLDPGENRMIDAVGDIEVRAAEAVSLGVTFGAATEQA